MRLRGPGLCCATVAREWFRISDLTLPQVLDIDAPTGQRVATQVRAAIAQVCAVRSLGVPSMSSIGPSSLLFLANRGPFRIGPLVPPMEGRKVARVPGLAESRSA